MNLVDTHAHLDFTDDVEGWCQRAKEAGVNKIICVGTSVEASRKCVEIAEKFSDAQLQIYATVGIHAQEGKGDINKFGFHYINIMKKIVESSRKVVAIGESGLDYFLENKDKRIRTSEEDKKFQEELFEAQIGLAVELGLPILIHCRNAWEETFSLLSTDYRLPTPPGLFHSWTGDWGAAKKALDLGFYISFSGIVTFKNAPTVQEVARKMPLERMLLETDSPFLSPHPLRGSPNEPKNVRIVAEFIAQLRNLPVERIAEITSRNAGRLFEI